VLGGRRTWVTHGSQRDRPWEVRAKVGHGRGGEGQQQQQQQQHQQQHDRPLTGGDEVVSNEAENLTQVKS
jgi:hypothetical protein